jgi:choline dehydrogenase-like flavoprotein
LLISDNSLFPSALSANPALTIMAVSLRIADCFLLRRKHKEILIKKSGNISLKSKIIL